MRWLWRFIALFRRDRHDYIEITAERRRMHIRHDMTVTLLLAGIIWTGPKLTPAQAAAILRDSPGESNRTHVRICTDCNGPRIVIFGTTDLGPWAFPPMPPTRPLSDQPYIYYPLFFPHHHR